MVTEGGKQTILGKVVEEGLWWFLILGSLGKEIISFLGTQLHVILE
jgi:hypothetical protein